MILVFIRKGKCKVLRGKSLISKICLLNFWKTKINLGIDTGKCIKKIKKNIIGNTILQVKRSSITIIMWITTLVHLTLGRNKRGRVTPLNHHQRFQKKKENCFSKKTKIECVQTFRIITINTLFLSIQKKTCF